MHDRKSAACLAVCARVGRELVSPAAAVAHPRSPRAFSPQLSHFFAKSCVPGVVLTPSKSIALTSYPQSRTAQLRGAWSLANTGICKAGKRTLSARHYDDSSPSTYVFVCCLSTFIFVPRAVPRGRGWQDSGERRRRGSCSHEARVLAPRMLSSGHGEAECEKVEGSGGAPSGRAHGSPAAASLAEGETFRLSKISQQEKGRGGETV